MATFEEVTQNHWPVCPFFPISCPNNYELVLQQQEVEHHVSQDCPLTLVQCDFHIVGCQACLARRHMPSHISENLTGHMSLLQVHMMTHSEENMATYLWLMVGSIQKVVLDNATIRSELHKTQETLRDTRDELQQSQSQQQETHGKLQETRHKLQETRDELQGTHETVAQLEVSCITKQEQNENLRRAIDICQEESTTLQQQKDDITKRLTASEQKIQALDTQLAAINSEKGQLYHKLEECSTQLEQHQQKTTLVHRELQEKIQQSSTQLQATVTAYEKETAAAQHNLHQHQRESEEKLTAAKDELTKKLSASEQKMYTSLNTQQDALAQQKHELTEKLSASEQKLQATLASQITKCRDENRRLQQSLTEQERKCEAKLKIVKDDLTCTITASEEKIQKQEATLNQHQKILENVTCTGALPFDFTMTEFEKHKRASDVWYSPPFYTHTHGYRMCIRVRVNSNWSRKGTHLAVHGWLMQGDFDDDLQWPFQGAITIQLLNQLKDSNHHTHTIKFTGTTDPDIISRVTSGERARSGWGTGIFLSHTQLGLNTDRNCQFLKDNQLKFRVSKATNLNPNACNHRRCLALESFARAIEPQVCVAPIEFSLPNFERHKKQNLVWYSPAFYTHPQGYRMCLRVYPNGTGRGLRTQVSIYTCLMQGPFDGGLKWPFRGDLTIQIVNQDGDNKHLEKVIPYTDQTDDDTAGRVTDKERSDSWGFSQFFPHSSLGYNAASNTQYLRGDSLRIRVSKVELKN